MLDYVIIKLLMSMIVSPENWLIPFPRNCRSICKKRRLLVLTEPFGMTLCGLCSTYGTVSSDSDEVISQQVPILSRSILVTAVLFCPTQRRRSVPDSSPPQISARNILPDKYLVISSIMEGHTSLAFVL